MTSFIARLEGRPAFCVVCAPGSPWNSGWRSCIERTRVASAATWSSYRTVWHCCFRSGPLRPPSLASGVSRHPGQASSRVGQGSCRRGSDGNVKTARASNSPQYFILNCRHARPCCGCSASASGCELAPTLTHNATACS